MLLGKNTQKCLIVRIFYVSLQPINKCILKVTLLELNYKTMKKSFLLLMLSLLISLVTVAQTPYVVWCSSNSTLYFTYRTENLLSGGSFVPEGSDEELEINKLWSNSQVTASPNTPEWYSTMSVCKVVVFETGFQNVHPKSTSKWFYSGRKIKTISGMENLNTIEVTRMNEMFYYCDLITSLDVSNFNTDNVTTMFSMFDNCFSLQSIDVSHFNTSKCTDMKHMFQGCKTLTELDLCNFDTKNVKNMFCMFNDSYSLKHINLNSFDTSNVENMSYMFNGCEGLEEVCLSSFNTSKVTDMSRMFLGCKGLPSIDLSSFNTSKVTNMSRMFYGCINLSKIVVSDLWSVKQVTSSDDMFLNCTSLVGGRGTTYDNSHRTHYYAHIDEVGNPGYFTASNDIIWKQPDLTVRKIEIDKQEVSPGENLQISWITANFGEQPTIGGWSEQVSLVSETGSTIKDLYLFNYDEVLPGESFVNHQVEVSLPFLLGFSGKARVQVKIIPNESTGEPEEALGNNSQTSDLALTVKNVINFEIVPSRLKEGEVAEVQATLSRSGNWNQSQYFNLYYSADNRIQKLSGVTIPAGQFDVVFSLGITNNNVFDADSVVTVEVKRSGYTSAQAKFTIIDDDLPKLNVATLKSEFVDGETFQLTVTADRAPATPTTLMLTCDHSVRFDFPSMLVLPAGETEVSTTVTVIDDHDIADTQSAVFTVSAENYESGETIVIVNDNDMPHIELELAPTAVSANASSNAIMGTIKRSDNLNSKVTIVLSDDTEGLLTYSPQQVTLERNATEAHFTVSPKGTVSTDQEVNITAAVYVKTCDCPAGAQSGGSTTQKLTLLAGEGAALNVEPLATDFSLDSNENSIVITIESPLQNILSVNVTSNFDDYLDYPHSVDIPAGDTSISIPVKKKGEGGISEGQVITFTATAVGYATSACWMIVTENSLPDAVISSFEVNATEAEAGSEVELTVVVKNVGSGQLSEETPVKVNLSDGSYPVMLKTGTVLSSGESTTLTTNYQLPLLTGNYSFQAIVNPSGKIMEAMTSNNMSQEIPITINPNFHATAVIDKSTYGQGEIITVTGKATGTKSAFVDVEVYFINDDMRQTVTAKTDAEGNYSAVFLPLDGTSGHFVIGACFPGEDKTDAMAEADVFGLTTASHRTTCQFSQGGSYSGVITVSNPGSLPQTGVRAEQQDAPEGCVFSFPVINKIEAGETLDIAYTINSVGNDATGGQKRMNVLVKSNEGALTEHAIDYSIEPAKGYLKTDSTSIAMTMTLGVAREFPITIWNEGMAPTGTISLTLPNWIESVTPQQLPSMASGDSVTVIFRIVPKDNMYLNIPKTGRIGMNCADGTGLSLSLEVTPVSEQNGTFTIDVIDEFTYCTEEKPHVSGAKVQVVNRSTQAVVAEGVTNAEGKFTANIPEGWYRLKISADYHESYDEYLLVDPGTNKTKRVFISFNGIDVDWKVDETEVEDEYSIETVVKFETRVPPPYIQIIWPKERPLPNRYYPITLVNKGLIRLTGVKSKLNLSSSMYTIEVMGNPNIDTLDAQQAVVLYAKLMPKNHVQNVRRVTNSGIDDCFSISIETVYGYECGEYVEKTITSIKEWGECAKNNHQTSSGGGGGSDSDDDTPSQPQKIACDLPKFKIVAAEDDVQGSRRMVRGTNGNSKKEEITMRGVAADGVSKVKIVLDGDYDTSKITDVTWELNESGCGTLSNNHSLEGAIYTAPSMFPPATNNGVIEYSHKLTFTLRCKIDKKEKIIPDAAKIELIRVPVVMVHGLWSDPSCWHNSWGTQGLYEFLKKNGYPNFNMHTVNYKGTHNESFETNEKVVSNSINDFIESLYKWGYYCSSVDVVAHSMGGLLTKFAIQDDHFDESRIHKLITINTPHGGSQLGNLLTDPITQFVHEINDGLSFRELIQPIDPFDYVTSDNFFGRCALDAIFLLFRPKNGDMNTGAVHDLRVNGEEIGKINNNKTKRVKCHSIVTATKITHEDNTEQLFADFFKTGISILDFIRFPQSLGFNSYEDFTNKIFNGDNNDLIVAAASQRGQLGDGASSVLPDNPPGNMDYTHVTSCHNNDVQREVLNLLLQDSRSNHFSDGFNTVNGLQYNTGMSWPDILMMYPYKTIANADDLYIKYNAEDPYYFDLWKKGELVPNRVRKMVAKQNLSSSSLALSHEYAEGSTTICIKVTPDGDFSEVSFGCFFNGKPFAYVNSTEGQISLPDKVQGNIVIVCEGRRGDGEWCIKSDIIPINTIGNTTMQKLSFVQDSVLIIDDEYLSPKVLCTWSDGTVTEVDNPTLSVTNGNLAYVEDNKYVYGKNSGHTNLVATYGNLTCSTPLEVYISTDAGGIEEEDDDYDSGNVCSTVTLSFKQKSVMTRQAFRGTLTLNNNHPSLPLENLKLQLEVRDEDGKIATQHEFQINPESLNGDFEGVLDFDSGWSLKSMGTGVATILFIPTRYAAPTEPKQWSFGGTISFTDPFTGLTMKYPLNPVTLTVKPSPVLDLTYFMQRDIYADDPNTTGVTEKSIPAEFALLVNNKGYTDAENLKFICKQPEIIDNEKGLLIDFSIISSQLNGKNKSIALNGDVPVSFGTVPSQSQAYAQWWLKSSLQGHFIEYDVNATHNTSYGNEDLSLIDQVSIHELIRGFTPLSSEESIPKRAFLVNDIEDSRDMPDIIYFSNATQLEVTTATETAISRQTGTEYILTVTPTKQGWTYAVLDNPVGGNVMISRITRQSDGIDIPVDNIWLTDRSFRDGKDPLAEDKLHFIGDVPEGGEQFLIEFELKPDLQLMVEAYEGVPAEDIEFNGALSEVTIHFNKSINDATFTVDDLTLYHEGVKVDVSAATITKIDGQTFKLNLGTATSQEGYYALMVNTQEITDIDGYEGVLSKEASWVQKEYEEPSVSIEVTDISQLTDAVYVAPFFARVGYDVEMAICLKNAQPATAYMFDLVLPKGITVATDTDGKYIESLSGRHDDHSRLINYRGDNTYTISTFSGNSEELKGNDGVIRLLTLHVGKDMAEGMYAVNINKASYSKPNGTLVKMPDTTSSVTVEDYVLGDVNADGKIDIGDVVCIINRQMGNENTKFVERAADVNKDGTVDISDADTIVDFLLGKTASLSR